MHGHSGYSWPPPAAVKVCKCKNEGCRSGDVVMPGCGRACDSWEPSVHPHQLLHPCSLAEEHVLSPLHKSGVFKDILCFTAASKNMPAHLEWWKLLLLLLSYISGLSIALVYTESERAEVMMYCSTSAIGLLDLGS